MTTPDRLMRRIADLSRAQCIRLVAGIGIQRTEPQTAAALQDWPIDKLRDLVLQGYEDGNLDVKSIMDESP